MKKRFLLEKTLIISSLCLFSYQASALISVQALGGLYKGTNDDEGTKTNFSGSEIVVAAHLDPIPLVPIGAGITLQIPNAKGTPDGSSDEITMTGLNLGLSLKAWSPVALFGVKPYLKLAYIVFGGSSFKQNTLIGSGEAQTKVDLEYLYKTSGTQASFGLEFSLIPLISALFEVEYQNLENKFDELKGMTGTVKDTKFSALNFLFGLSVGI